MSIGDAITIAKAAWTGKPPGPWTIAGSVAKIFKPASTTSYDGVQNGSACCFDPKEAKSTSMPTCGVSGLSASPFGSSSGSYHYQPSTPTITLPYLAAGDKGDFRPFVPLKPPSAYGHTSVYGRSCGGDFYGRQPPPLPVPSTSGPKPPLNGFGSPSAGFGSPSAGFGSPSASFNGLGSSYSTVGGLGSSSNIGSGLGGGLGSSYSAGGGFGSLNSSSLSGFGTQSLSLSNLGSNSCSIGNPNVGSSFGSFGSLNSGSSFGGSFGTFR